MSNLISRGRQKRRAASGSRDERVVIGDIKIEGNLNGVIVAGHGNRVYQYTTHHNHGAIINYHTKPAVKPRDVKPQPPRAPRTFVGREDELETLTKVIKGRQAALIIGHDGVGKTTLIRQAANSDAAKSMPDGVPVVNGLTESGDVLGFQDVLQQLFDMLYESEPHLKIDSAIAQTYLSNTKPLVLIDGIDFPLNYLSALPDFFPQGAIFVSSRTDIQTEAFESIELTPLPRMRSLQLLAALAGLQSDPITSPILDEICALLGDFPLSITNAANFIRKKGLSPGALADQLRRIEPRSSDLVVAGLERINELLPSVLSGGERDALLTAALAPGLSIDRDILGSIAGKEGTAALEDLGLLQANSPSLSLPGGMSHLVHTSLATFTQLQEKLLDRVLTQLQPNALEFDYRRGELGAAIGLLNWTVSHERWSDVIRLGKVIDPYLMLRGLWGAWRATLEKILTAAEQLSDPVTRAWALHQLGTEAAGETRLDRARNLLQQALEIRKDLGDEVGAAYTQHNLWVLFPPPPIDREPPGGGTGGIFPWLIPALIAIGAIIAAILYLIPWPEDGWLTYTNPQYGFQFRYPPDVRLQEYAEARLPLVAEFGFPNPPEDEFDKHLAVVVNQSGVQDPCQVGMNQKDWAFKSIYIEDVPFTRATKRNFDPGAPSYEIYITSRQGANWICLVFSYTPKAPDPDRGQSAPSEAEAAGELGVFAEISKTFGWLPITAPPVIITTPPTATNSTPPTAVTATTITPTPVTPSVTPPPTSTYTPTPTWTSTACVPNTRWVTYTVQAGDNLFRISQWYPDLNITVADLQKANCKDTTDIRVGERLYVPRTPPPASIIGIVFSDLNRNDIQDGSEAGIPNITITLTDPNGLIVATTTTNSIGYYEFRNLVYGLYYVFQYPVSARPNEISPHNFGLSHSP